MLKKDRVAHYLEKAERLEYIIPNFDPANGDMILGAEFRSYIFQAIREKAN
jgi:hypothetical protein